MKISRCARLLCSVWVMALGGCRSKEPTPRELPRAPGPRRPPPQYLPVRGAVGPISQALLFADSLKVIGGRLEIRSLPVVRSDSTVLPLDYETVLELRSGELVTVIGGKSQKRVPGDMWLAPRGSRITLRVLGEHAVLRAITLIR
jgi:hypothetical protein